MILEIRQKREDGRNCYEIREEDLVLYVAETGAGSKNSADGEAGRNVSLMSLQNRTVLETEHRQVSGAEAGIPEGWLSGSGEIRMLQVNTGAGEPEGCFSFEQRGIRGNRILLCRDGIWMCGFVRYDGSREVLSFHVGSVQVGQMVRSVASGGNGDTYWLHMLELYEEWLPFLALFAAAYDTRKHSGTSGMTRKNSDLMQVISSVQNEDTGKRDFVETCFGREESLRLDALLDENEQNMRESMAGEVKNVGRWILLGWAAATAVFLAVIWGIGL